jgi:SlyX protein
MAILDSELIARLDDLESRLAFQDDLIENLNAVIARHDRDLARVLLQLKDLTARVSDLADANDGPGLSSGHEVPPHY